MKLSRLFVLILIFPLLAQAQRGDRKGHVMTEVWRDMDVPAAPALGADDALKTFRIAPGFRLEIAASEPLIEDPVTVNWDGDGRMWVVEMRGYMPNVDGSGEEKLKTGRVSVLTDEDGDGRMDKSAVFLDELIMPRALSLVKGGVLISEPPNLWFCEDTDGDLKCDKKTKLANYAKVGPVEHTDNALMPGMDNWLYSAKSSRRLRLVDGKLQETKSTGRGQWGMSMDDYGRLVYTTNSNYLHGDWDICHNLGGKYKIGIGDKDVWTIRVNPGINRGYDKNMLRKDGRLARITGISGPGFYRASQYPSEYQGGIFIPEPCGNAVAFFQVEDKVSSLAFKHQTYADPDWQKREFLASTDERFRPVSMATGPDGCMYVVDLYRGILQHKVYVTTFLRKQIIERKLDEPIGLGRIYRIVHEGTGRDSSKPALETADSATLVKTLSHNNGWRRDTAQRLLVQQADKGSIAALRGLASSSDKELARIHALWTLEGIGALDTDTVSAAISADSVQVRIHALSAGDSLTKGDTAGPMLALIGKALTDKDDNVRKLATYLGKRARGEIKVVAERKSKPISGTHKKVADAGKEVYMTTCFACHQVHGKGMDSVAPPLVDSDWVLGDPTRAIKVALDGISGDIKVSGKTYTGMPIMPGHRAFFDDKKIAAVLTYVRHAWGNNGGMVEADAVKKIRAATADRGIPWTAAELK
ncbi:MAG: mono/diheme cytochrome c family protein/glucose/arabinose dehydrogenase [Rhodothermales bacterium]|jgi:mono/diheme cytochrome c family protein/glucose/arabinose dehydrogenase